MKGFDVFIVLRFWQKDETPDSTVHLNITPSHTHTHVIMDELKPLRSIRYFIERRKVTVEEFRRRINSEKFYEFSVASFQPNDTVHDFLAHQMLPEDEITRIYILGHTSTEPASVEKQYFSRYLLSMISVIYVKHEPNPKGAAFVGSKYRSLTMQDRRETHTPEGTQETCRTGLCRTD
jgi:hypothetical protein